MKKIIAVFPGTFDPIHIGHIDIALRSAKLFDKLVVAVYNKPLKNLLFSPEERFGLVKEAFKDEDNILVTGYNGLTVEFCRKIGAAVVVRGLRVFSDFEHEFRMALTNHKLAPEIETMNLITREELTFLSSTTVREVASLHGDISGMVPPFVQIALEARFQFVGEDGHEVVQPTSLRD